jgi:type VI secretion system protein ImpM
MSLEHVKIGYFGKVPTHADFIRYNAGGTEIHQMDQWFQEALHFASTSLGGQWKEEYSRSSSHRFLFHPDDREQSVLGVCVPSQDQSGRTYPFLVFAVVDSAHFQPDPTRMPVVFSTFLGQAEDVARSGWRDADPHELVSHVESLRSSLSGDWEVYTKDYARVLAEQTCHGFWTGLFGAYEDARKYVLFKNLVEWMKPFRNTDPRSLRSGLRYPLAPGTHPTEYLVAFWVELTGHLVGHTLHRPTLFWSSNADVPPGLFLFFRPPAPRSYLHFIRPGTESDSVWDLVADDVEYGGEAYEKLPSEHRACLDDPGRSLAEFLQSVRDLSI